MTPDLERDGGRYAIRLPRVRSMNAESSDRPGEGEGETVFPVSNMLPNFLIIGAMRSGTTSLARYLGSHPDVFMAPQKEVHFFDRNFQRGADWYRSQFRTSGAQLIGEATQTYLFEATVPERMATLVPEARLIAILRDPVDRAYSHYLMNREAGGESLTFMDALESESRRLASGNPAATRTFSYVKRGLYLQQLLEVCRWFPRAQLHVMLFDDLRDRPAETYRSLCDWLGLVPFLPTNLGEQLNAHVRFRSVRVRRLAKRLPTVGRRAVGALNTYRTPYDPMDPQLRRELKQLFSQPNERLADWLNRDLSIWAD